MYIGPKNTTSDPILNLDFLHFLGLGLPPLFAPPPKKNGVFKQKSLGEAPRTSDTKATKGPPKLPKVPAVAQRTPRILAVFSAFGCFQKLGYPQIIHFNRVFRYKPSILGYLYFWKHLSLFPEKFHGTSLVYKNIRLNGWFLWYSCG